MKFQNSLKKVNRDLLTQRERESFDKALKKITEVDHEAIQNKLNKIKSNQELDLLLTANDKEFAPLITQYCNKSGRELRKLDLHDIKRLIEINGRVEAINLLQETSCSQYAPEWLHTEPKSLNKLMIYDINGYFIYAASHIFHSDIIKKTNLVSRPPIPILDSDTEVNDFLFSFPTQDKPEDFKSVDIPKGTHERYFNLQDKFISRRKLDLYINPILITEANELLRKFLGLCKPENSAKICGFSFSNLHEITEDEQNFKIFINEIKSAIKDLISHYYKMKQTKKSEKYAQSLKSNYISSADIASIKAAFGGLSNFHAQPKIRNLSKKESILYDLRGFLGLDAESDSTLAMLRGTNKDKNNLNFSSKAFKVKKGFKLKFKSD